MALLVVERSWGLAKGFGWAVEAFCDRFMIVGVCVDVIAVLEAWEFEYP